MKFKKWHKWLLFFVAFWASLFLLEKLFDFGLKHNLNLKSAYISSHKIDADILVLGPCEPLWMVAPEMITYRTGLSCYNLASSHSDFADNYLHLQLYLKNNRAPKYMLLYVTPESFDTGYNTFHGYRFLPFSADERIKKALNEFDPSQKFRYLPFASYAWYSHQTAFLALQGWKHYLMGKEKPYYPDGFEPPGHMVWDNHHENLKKLYPKGYSFSWDSSRQRYLELILTDCAKRGIRVLVYESPILKEIADFQLNRGIWLGRIETITRKHGFDYVKFDELKWAGDRKYFISPMVSTFAGSYMFSDTLGAWLREKVVK